MFMQLENPYYTKMEQPYLVPEPTEAEKKRARFGTMFTLHALLNRAGVEHEKKHTLTCMGYCKSKDRF